MLINTNLSAASLATGQTTLAKPLAQLATAGATDSISASDLSSSLDPQLSGISAAESSVANAVSFTQSQAGLLQGIGKALDQMQQLANSAHDPATSSNDRASDNQQFQSLAAYITTTAARDFNGVSLFNGSGVSVSVDGNGDSTTLSGINLGTPAYASAESASISTTTGAASALASVQTALKQLSADRATAGSNLSHLGSLADQLAISSENISAASDFADPAGAQQATSDASTSILGQSSTALLAQGNQLPQSVLDLLGQLS
ncbi:MAG TPA: flagellin [Verrucomicrobiae bacterium]|jgi:flagellin|nr:flagellin [Verrucomicrobiae bacterium]